MPSFTSTLLFAAAMASLSNAMKIIAPTKFQLWDSSKSNTITWTSVSTDPKTVDIYLAHMAAHPPLYSLLFSDVSTSDGSATVSGLQLPNGENYQINLVASDNENQILAQSEQFNVTGQAVAGATSTLDGYTGPTYTPTASGSGSATRSASLTTMTSTRTNANGSAVTETATSTSSSEDAESTDSSSSSSTPSQTVSAASGTSASASSTSTPNAAAGNFVASGSMLGLFVGVAALLI